MWKNGEIVPHFSSIFPTNVVASHPETGTFHMASFLKHGNGNQII
jgi:hypothetical protein